MTELMTAPPQQDREQMVDQDTIDKHHGEALASNRNESNIVAWKAIAEAHMQNPDSRVSPLRANIGVIDYRTFSSTDPSVRVVTAENGNDYKHTADTAIAEAQKERIEADKQAQLAAERHDALKSL